jgi:Ca-activated chloride channel family protein
MLNPNWYYNSLTDGHGVLEVLGTDAKGFIPLQSTVLRGRICGPLASLKVTHRFRFTKEECPETLEAAYRFPLPGDAAMSGVFVTFGDTTIEARLERRDLAEKEYAEAKQDGRKASLVTRERPDVFTLYISGIEPDEEVSVTSSFLILGAADGVGYMFRIPLTTAPRYARSDERDSRSAKGQPLAVLVDPGHRFFLDIECPSGRIESASHELEAHDTAYTLADGEVTPDRDLLLSWRPREDQERPKLVALADGKSKPAFLLMVTPPRGEQEQAPLDLQILVDHSGSMEGPKWAAADWAVEKLLSSLKRDDTFNLCLFESNTHWFREEPVKASPEHVAEAKRFLMDRTAGGTELGLAIEQALRQPERRGRSARHLVVITDAQVSDDGRILRLIEDEREKKRGRRCSVVCIDSAPNSYLANEVAEAGRGIARFLTSSPGENDITNALDDVLTEISRPLLSRWRISTDRTIAPGGTLEFDRRKGIYSAPLDYLPSGRTTYVLVRGEEGLPGGSFSLLNEDGEEIDNCLTEEMTGVGAVYGARLISRLEQLAASGLDRKAISEKVRAMGEKLPPGAGSRPVYSENRLGENRALVSGLLAEVSLRYGVISSETGFIAVSKKKGSAPTRTVAVPNALADGWDDKFVTAGGGARRSIPRPMANAMPATNRIALDSISSHRSLLSLSSEEDRYCRLQSSSIQIKDARRLMDYESAWPDDQEDLLERSDRPGGGTTGPLFAGTAVWKGGEAVLFDSADKRGAAVGPSISRLSVALNPGVEVRGLVLLLFLDDMQMPKVRVRLEDLRDLGGSRPLNLRYTGERLRIVLMRESGSADPGRIEVTLW